MDELLTEIDQLSGGLVRVRAMLRRQYDAGGIASQDFHDAMSHTAEMWDACDMLLKSVRPISK